MFRQADRAMATDWKRVLAVYGCGVIAAFQLGKVPPLAAALRQDLGQRLFGSAYPS